MDTQGKEGVSGAPIRIISINMPSKLATMLPMSFIVPERHQRGPASLPPEKSVVYNYIPYNTGECPLANIIRKLQSIILDIETTIARYQMIKIQRYGRARAGKIVELEGALSPWYLLVSWLAKNCERSKVA